MTGEEPIVDSDPPFDIAAAEIASWHRRAVGHLLQMGAGPDLSEDLASEAVLRLWSYLRRGGAPQNRSAYLSRIARNLYVDHIRQEVRDRSRMAALMSREMTRAAESADHHEAVALAAVIKDARSRLPRRYQQVLACTIDFDMSHRQIALRLDLPSEGAAAVLAHRARRALVEALLDVAAGSADPSSSGRSIGNRAE